MDPHFHEYLAAITGMHDVYGDRTDEHPTEFHDEREGAVVEQPTAAAA